MPLTSRDIAAETGFHVATVNRCLAMVSARTSRGIHPLRRLTSHPVGAGGASADALRASLAALLREHGPDLPSDAALARALAQNGITVARRTVTKYRLELQRGQAGIAAGDA